MAITGRGEAANNGFLSCFECFLHCSEIANAAAWRFPASFCLLVCSVPPIAASCYAGGFDGTLPASGFVDSRRGKELLARRGETAAHPARGLTGAAAAGNRGGGAADRPHRQGTRSYRCG